MRPSNLDPLVFNRIFVVYSRDSGLTRDDFEEAFQHIGVITDVHLMKDKATGRFKGVAYIRFEKTSQACIACETMNGEMIPGNPRRIRVHIAQDRKELLEVDVDEDEMLHRLFIKHPREEDEDEIRKYFSQWGNVTWMYVLKDKKTGAKRGAAFIKFEKQSQAALAKEECDSKYGPRWADVRAIDPEKQQQYSQRENQGGKDFEMGGAGMGFEMGGNGMGFNMGGNGMGFDMGGGGMGAGMNEMGGMGSNMSVMSMMSGGDGCSNVLEALVPNSMTQNQVCRLFDIVPGLQNCTINPMTGMATIMYSNSACAAHAKQKIDGFDMFGSPIAIRFSRGAAGLQGGGSNEPTSQLQNALQTLKSAGTGNMQALVQSIQQVTKVISRGPELGPGSGGYAAATGAFGGPPMDAADISTYCNRNLPPKKPFASPHAEPVAKVFILSMPGPELPPSELMENVCCRFGGLINWQWLRHKRFGFALYDSHQAAETAVKELHGMIIMDNQLKVEMSNLAGDAGPSQKRPRMW